MMRYFCRWTQKAPSRKSNGIDPLDFGIFQKTRYLAHLYDAYTYCAAGFFHILASLLLNLKRKSPRVNSRAARLYQKS